MDIRRARKRRAKKEMDHEEVTHTKLPLLLKISSLVSSIQVAHFVPRKVSLYRIHIHRNGKTIKSEKRGVIEKLRVGEAQK